MSQRRSRRKYEQIYTRRARQGFPAVSPLILHNDGSIEPRPHQYRMSFAPTFQMSLDRLSLKDRAELESQLPGALSKIARNPYVGEPIDAGIFGKLLNKLRWLIREIEVRYESMTRR